LLRSLSQGCGGYGCLPVPQPFVRLIEPLANGVEVTKQCWDRLVWANFGGHQFLSNRTKGRTVGPPFSGTVGFGVFYAIKPC